jgi:hypothetical protein
VYQLISWINAGLVGTKTAMPVLVPVVAEKLSAGAWVYGGCAQAVLQAVSHKDTCSTALVTRVGVTLTLHWACGKLTGYVQTAMSCVSPYKPLRMAVQCAASLQPQAMAQATPLAAALATAAAECGCHPQATTAH